MRAPGFAVIAALLIGTSLIVLVAIGGRERTAPVRPEAASPQAAAVRGGGFTLMSTRVELPIDEAVFPPRPDVDLVNQRCLACHSASMVLAQPRLKAEQWQAIVAKMRDVYGAPVSEHEAAPIVAYLVGRQGNAGLDDAGMNRAGMDKAGMDKAGMDKTGMDKTGAAGAGTGR